MRDLLMRFIVVVWALVMRVTHGRLPFGTKWTVDTKTPQK